MIMEFEDLEIGDLGLGENVEQHEQIVEHQEESITNDIFDEPTVNEIDPLISDLLKLKGIEGNKITILDDNDQPQEIDFNSLSREEQIEILNSAEETNQNTDLDDSEIEFLNALREKGISVDDFLTQYKEIILAEVNAGTEPTYDIDSYDDNELFILDLKNKYDDFTDEELQAELELALQNKEMFDKKVGKLRLEYKQLEDEFNANQKAEFENQQKAQYDQFANTMVDIATNVEDFHGIYLEDEEKNETLSYLLDLDEAGVTQLTKDLNNPLKLFEAAWYLRYGKEAFAALESAYEAEIQKLKKDKPSVVVRNSNKNPENIHDLHF